MNFARITTLISLSILSGLGAPGCDNLETVPVDESAIATLPDVAGPTFNGDRVELEVTITIEPTAASAQSLGGFEGHDEAGLTGSDSSTVGDRARLPANALSPRSPLSPPSARQQAQTVVGMDTDEESSQPTVEPPLVVVDFLPRPLPVDVLWSAMVIPHDGGTSIIAGDALLSVVLDPLASCPSVRETCVATYTVVVKQEGGSPFDDASFDLEASLTDSMGHLPAGWAIDVATTD